MNAFTIFKTCIVVLFTIIFNHEQQRKAKHRTPQLKYYIGDPMPILNFNDTSLFPANFKIDTATFKINSN